MPDVQCPMPSPANVVVAGVGAKIRFYQPFIILLYYFEAISLECSKCSISTWLGLDV